MSSDALRHDPPAIGLSRKELLASLALLVLVFLFVEGPIYKDPWNMSLVDRAIGWSYAPIPIFVAIVLYAKKRLEPKGLLLDTMALTFAKFAVTAVFALTFWWKTKPPAEAAPIALPPAETTKTAPVPTPIAREDRGDVEVKVTDANGAPARGALVFVASGLERYVFAPPKEAVEITNDGRGFEPRVLAAMIGQTIEARSTDGELHSMMARRGDDALFHAPLLRSGAPSRVTADEAGEYTLTCVAHQSAHEAAARLVVLTHPYFARTDDRGVAKLEGVPKGSIVIEARTASASGRAGLHLQGADKMDISITP